MELVLLVQIFVFSLRFVGASQERAQFLRKRATTSSPRKIEQQERKFFKFVTRPDIDAPTWNVELYDEEALAPGYWFLAPYQDLDQKRPGDAWVGPHIYDGHGELIWSGTGMFQHWNTFDFGLSTIGDQQMMTVLFPHGKAGLILDDQYQIWEHVSLDGLKADMHAFRLINEGKRALVLTHEHVNTTVEEAWVVGFNRSCSVGYIGFAELDVHHPNPPVFSWNAYHHISLDEGTYNRDRLDEECTHTWDLLHANSIDKFPDGDYLISTRHTDALYKISHIDGSIVWRLGGVKSDFDFIGRGNAKFSRQHHARVVAQNTTQTTISLFDNAVGTGPDEHESNSEARGLVLKLDTVRMTARILAEYRNPQGHTVSSRGSFQTLPNGNAFLCWTYSSHISEHTPDGALVMDAILPVAAHSYRAFKYPWVGRPTQAPDVFSKAISNQQGATHTMIYVSWNGATEVAGWGLLEAHPSGDVNETILALVNRNGFETEIIYEGALDYVVVEGFDAAGESLGRSEMIRTLPLEEQGFNQILHSESYDHGYQQDYAALDRTRRIALAIRRTSNLAFVLGFISCAIIGAVLHWSSRRSDVRWRRRSGRGPKYELLMQEHLQ